jgi:hypothetical protein
MLPSRSIAAQLYHLRFCSNPNIYFIMSTGNQPPPLRPARTMSFALPKSSPPPSVTTSIGMYNLDWNDLKAYIENLLGETNVEDISIVSSAPCLFCRLSLT